MIIRDQFLSSVDPELRLYLNERNVGDIQEMTRLADNWSQARRKPTKYEWHVRKSSSMQNPSDRYSDGKSCQRAFDPTFSRASQFQTRPIKQLPSLGMPATNTFSSNIKCHGCGLFGHKKSNCPKNPSWYPKTTKLSQEHGLMFVDRTPIATII